MKPKSAYQKLKEENNELLRKLIVISRNPKSMEAMNIMLGYKIMLDVEEQIMSGSPTINLRN